MDNHDLQVEKKEKENASLKSIVFELKEQCEVMAKEMNSLKEKIAKTDDELALSKERNLVLGKEMSSLQQKIGELDDGVNSAKDQNTTLRKELDLMKEKNCLLEEEIIKMKIKDHELSTKNPIQSEEPQGEVKAEDYDIVEMSPITQNTKHLLKKPITLTRFKCTSADATLMPNNHIKFNKNPDNPSNYSTVIASHGGVPKGEKVFYEVTLIKCESGDLRIGWVNGDFLVSKQSKSTGGCVNSYGYDPVAGWKITSSRGQLWGRQVDGSSNLVVGVAIDMVRGEIKYGVDGKWNVAFQDINKNCSHFPALTGGSGAYVSVNFGEMDFKYGPPEKSYAKLIDSCS